MCPAFARTPDSVKPNNDRTTLEHDVLEPIAVVGFSLKFPGDATSAESFWNMLIEGRCASEEFPKDRLNLNAFYDPNPDIQGTLPLRGGHFVHEDITTFDAPFFSMTSAETASMDPQQRGLLEVSYRAFENAGIPLDRVLGSKTSVHIGCFSNDQTVMNSRDPENISQYTAIGQAASMLSNRLSWFFDLDGPSLTLDTACSSSMVALDMACQALQTGQSNMSLVGGCNLMWCVDSTMALSNLGFLSHDSRCYSFDHRANGYARGEGFGVVVLKRVADAIRDGDIIRAVIRSTGSNQDGKTPGITLPSKDAQTRLIKETYQKAGLDMQKTNFFEAHGTGTPVGDPIEAYAIGNAFKHSRLWSDPLYIGAVKGNIGHLEGASGVAGLIKTIMVLEKGIIPPNTNYERLNPHIDAEFLNIQFPLESTIWPGNGLRRASINSFGFGGTNSHAVVDDAYNYLRLRNLPGKHRTVEEPTLPERSNGNLQSSCSKSGFSRRNSALSTLATAPKLLVWSAADEAGLARLASCYSQHFSRLPLSDEEAKNYLEDLAYTLNMRRSKLSWKSFAVVNAFAQLEDLNLSRPIQGIEHPRLAFIFTGQGAQWYAMGRELLIYPVFKLALLDTQNFFQSLGCDWSLFDELLKEERASNIHEPKLSQPLCTALQIALVDLLRTFGIYPAAVVGHSSGEIAAAYCTGALSRQSACKVAYYRGVLASKLAAESQTRHTMMSVGLPEDQIEFYLKKVGQDLGGKGMTISCINSPKNVTISGTEPQIDALKFQLKEDNVFYRELPVNLAYHSPQMNEIAAEYLIQIEHLEVGDFVKPDRTKFISSVTGQATSAKELCKAEYWVRNMISPVRFKEALENTCYRPNKEIRKKLDGSHRDIAMIHNILEIGPHSTLRGPTRDILQAMGRDKDISYIAGLIRHRNAHETILEAVGCLYCLGYFVDLQAVNQPQAIHQDLLLVLPDLPEYPFDHSQTYFNESRLSRGHRFRQQPRVELLGSQVPDWNPFEARWRSILKLVEIPWVAGHQINGSVLFPAAGMLVMAIEAARQMSDYQKILGFEIRDVTFNAPINLSLYPDGIETQFHLRPLKNAADKSNNWSEFRLYICEAEKWAETCRGLILVECEKSSTEVDEGLEAAWIHKHHKELYKTAIRDCVKVANTRYVYHRLKEFGFNYGSAFQPLKAVRYSDSQAIAELMLFSGSTDKNVVIHPTSLDGVFQLPLIALTKGGTDTTPTTIPTRINRLWISNAGLCTPGAKSIEVYASITIKGHRTTESSIFALDSADQQLRIKCEGMETTSITHAEISANSRLEAKHMFYNVDWKPDITICDERQLLEYCKSACVPKFEPEDFFQDLTLLLLSFIKKTSTELKEVKHSVSYLKNYITWMQRQLQDFDNGSLAQSRLEWNCFLDDPAWVDSTSERLEGTNKQGALYVKVGRNLTKILSGEIDPFKILFGDGLTKSFYENLNESAQCFDKLAVYLDAYTHKNPAMKVLEVGAGRGSITALILKTLGSHGEQEPSPPRYTQYDYTNISASSLDEAQESFAGYSRMKFRTLNIEIDPAAQDFETGSYDLIIAANVVHATQDLNITLQNIRKLLKIGGKLILVELVRPDIVRAGFAFGLLPEWWLSSEDYRSRGPCISEHKWHDILTLTGFSGIDLEFRDFESDICHEFSIIVSSTTLATTTPPLSATAPQSLVIAQANSEILRNLSIELKARLERSISPSCKISFFQPAAFFTEHLCDQCCIILEEREHSILRDISPENFNALKSILLSSRAVLWVTDSRQTPMTPDYGMAQGLARVLRTENSKLNFVTLALESRKGFDGQPMECIIKAFSTMVQGLTDTSHEPEYIEKNGMLHISRLVEANYLNQDVFIKTSPQQLHTQKIKDGPPLRLSIGTPGLLDTFRFTEDMTHTHPLAPSEIEIEVKAIGINFLDCLIALGRVDMTTFGSECAGIITRVGDNCQLSPGDRVSLLSADLFRTQARCMEDCAIKIPNHLSFVEAAVIPVAFSTVYYGLYEVAHAQRGETILIHSGAGGTGQAAIQIAQIIGLEIFATVGSDEKKQLLIDTYRIPESHILFSRDLSFAQGIKRLTKRGVDIVLNSLAGEGLVASWECMAPYGRFIEIGKKDIYSHGMLPMFPFAANVSFHAIDLAFEPRNRPPVVRRSIENSFKLLASNKIHPPQPIHKFGLSEVEKAFRYLQSGRNTGKTVIELDRATEIPMFLELKPDYSFDANATYLIAGGLGGLGRCIAKWLVRRGTRNLLLLSRSGPGQKAKALIDELRSKGTRVETPICDVTDASSIARMLSDHQEILPPIKGCMQCSMVLKDATFETMSVNDWEACIGPKVQGSWNLHALLPKKMDFFILLSSISGIIGNGGQANYAAGNAYQDALARYRVALGEKAVALDIGALMSEGFLAENDSSLSGAIRDGILPPMLETELLALLDHYCNPSVDVSSPLKCQAVTGIEIPANIRAKGAEEPYWLKQPLFCQLHQINGTAASFSIGQEQGLDFAAVFAATPSLSEAAAIVSDALVKKLSRIMGVQPEHIDSNKPMSSYGVDSLVAVELRNWFSQELGADTAIFEILSEPSIFAVGMLVVSKSNYRQASWAE